MRVDKVDLLVVVHRENLTNKFSADNTAANDGDFLGRLHLERNVTQRLDAKVREKLLVRRLNANNTE